MWVRCVCVLPVYRGRKNTLKVEKYNVWVRCVCVLPVYRGRKNTLPGFLVHECMSSTTEFVSYGVLTHFVCLSLEATPPPAPPPHPHTYSPSPVMPLQPQLTVFSFESTLPPAHPRIRTLLEVLEGVGVRADEPLLEVGVDDARGPWGLGSKLTIR